MPPPSDLDFWPFDLEVGVGVACHLGYPCAKFRIPRPFVIELEPMYATSDRRMDRRTTDADDRLMPPPPLRGRGHNKIMWRPFWLTFDNIDTRVDIAVIKACKIKTCIDNKTFQYNADNISLPYMIQQTSASELRHDTRRNARRNKYTLTTQILTTATQTGLEADWLCSLKVEKITEKVLQQNTVYMSVNHTQSFLPPRRVT